MGPLYARSEFSLLQSVLRIEEYLRLWIKNIIRPRSDLPSTAFCAGFPPYSA